MGALLVDISEFHRVGQREIVEQLLRGTIPFERIHEGEQRRLVEMDQRAPGMDISPLFRRASE